MSEDLLVKFIEDINYDDGLITKKQKKRKEKKTKPKRKVSRLDGEDGEYTVAANVKKGISLIEEARNTKDTNFRDRNVKYMKYLEKKQLQAQQSKAIMSHHGRSLKKTKLMRQTRNGVRCLREPKQTKKSKGSIFSDKDFKRILQKDNK